ncbi:MAG: hypothetical protein DRP56_01285 [Planctomycetota bacterium]|nr:MAG: hypothetical protein DRP56_01285 [Planctomycetota bacterium]
MSLTDVDILKVEPSLFSDDCFSSQVLCGGTNGIVAGTQFTASGVDFTASGVTAGGVIHLSAADGSIDGGFEIVSIIDSTHITVSILRSDPTAGAIPVGSASGLTWSIKTYAPQISVAETQLSHRLRCLPGWEAATVTLDELENAEAVRLVCLHLLLGMLFGTLYGTFPAYTADTADVWQSHKDKCVRYRAMTELMIRAL